MRYAGVVPAVFLDRPNRFVAEVELAGRRETVHVKNTGRCRELLVPGAEVYLAPGENPGRKTAYDLVAVRKAGGLLVNMDSQAPNRVVREWLAGQGFDAVRPEFAWGGSRIDFRMERRGPGGTERYLMEVKGCTLEAEGIGYFPDAPTARGVRHIRELIRAAGEGWRAVLAFVIQMDGVTEVRPNAATDPAFAEAMEAAAKAGVRVLCLPCHVEPDSLTITAGRLL